ncbi:hypothetical protein AAD006_006077 [Klebsiella michiganensis]|nr:hypothetical protein [Klebsiella michiganensis]
MNSGRGGFYAGTALEDMDFQERFLRNFLAFLSITCVEFVRSEGPAKDEEIKLRAISSIVQIINIVSTTKE